MGVGLLGAPDPAPEAVTNYYVTPPLPPERHPFSKPFHAAPQNDRNRILRTQRFLFLADDSRFGELEAFEAVFRAVSGN